MLAKFSLSLIAGLVWLTSFVATAAEWPMDTGRNTEVISLPNGDVDMALRMDMIRNAKHSIEWVTYLQGKDEDIGGPILKVTHEALKRPGMTGRFLWDEHVAEALDFLSFGNDTEKMLAHGDSQVICLTPTSKYRCGLNKTDFFHEKILIIDRGTPDEKIIVGGRNHHAYDKKWHDHAEILRPIDWRKPYIGTQIKEAYDRTWETASRIQAPKDGTPSADSYLERKFSRMKSEPEEILSAEALKEFEDLRAVLAKPAGKSKHPQVFRPQAARVVTNDFMEQALTGKHGKSIDDRRLTMKSDIHDRIAAAIAGADRVDLSSMTLWFPPQVEAELNRALDRGAHIRIFTDGKEAHCKQINKGICHTFNLEQLKRLVDAAEGKPGKLEVLAFQPGTSPPGRTDHPLDYSHEKIVIAHQKDGSVITFTGPDNLNELSRVKNNEYMIEYHDPRYGAYQQAKMERNLDSHYEPMSAAQIRREHSQINWCSRMFTNLAVDYF